MGWGAAIGKFLEVVALLLKEWIKGQPKREEKRNADENEQFRQGVANHNQPAVQSWLKRMLSQGKAGGDPPRGKS